MVSLVTRKLPSLALVALSLSAQPLLAEGGKHAATMIVMDGSGSMWGQIDGRPKLEIARETASNVLSQLPADRVLGLIAYGHRERGNCSDIELVVPPAAGTAPAILGAVNTMRFQGKTPLTESVRQAAAALRSTEAPATVILVTDGIETCEADPCALSAELEASGVDFTAHVIGFGLSRDEGAAVACIAENTGGRYLPAADAASLAGALQQAVSPETPPPVAQPEPAPMDRRRHYPGAPWMEGFSIAPTGETFGEEFPRLEELDFPGEAPAEACRALCDGDPNCASWRYEPKGSYFVDHARCFRFQAGVEFWPNVYPVSEGFVSGLKDGVIGLVTPYIPLGAAAEASLSVSEKVEPDQEFTVLWSGPGAARDWVGLAPAGQEGPHGDIVWFYPEETIEPGDRPEGAGTLMAPSEPGIYDLRYVLGRDPDQRVLFKMQLGVGVDIDTPKKAALAVAEVRFTVPAAYRDEVISWSATPLTPHPDAPEALAMPEAFAGDWEAELYPGRWKVEGEALSGMYFAATIDVGAEAGQRFEIPVGFETEGMGEDDAQEMPASEEEVLLAPHLPDGWTMTEAFRAETAAGVRSTAITATFAGPSDQYLLLNPLQWLESNGSCEDTVAGPLCLMGKADGSTQAARDSILAALKDLAP